ncbi:MAG: hypothetical protein V4467_02180 [Patescibacteria group bacterium]
MADIDTEKLEELLAQKKGKEAAELLKNFFDNISEEQKGAAYAEYALIHMKVMNAIDDEYKEYLKDVLAKLQMLKSAESKTTDMIKLKQARVSLS